MAGERSKSSGEFGEKVVSELLKLIGWGNADFNPTISCLNGEHLRKSNTHGLDFIISFESSLINHLQDDVLISVKHNLEGYPPSPTNNFKKYLVELAEAIECFPYDEQYGVRYVSNSIEERKTSGVIFWISSKDDEEKDLVKEIKAFRGIDKNKYGPIYLVDNNRANFLYRSIAYAKNKFKEYKFFYHPTGFNDNDPFDAKNYGDKLPVQLVNTNILPIRVVPSGNGPTLLLFVNEKFNESSLRRVMGFAQRLTRSWANQAIILYYDYLEVEHKNMVQSSKRLFEDSEFIQTIEVRSFRDTIPTLGEE